ncbi:hypothetical protein K445DRAFT_7539 [Daldinia sp. EC12]|nr:hypothetical protein K445DRAFT_7539 [Daldinia sp. EC12]
MSEMYDFLVMIPDYPGMEEERQSGEKAHIAHLKDLVQSGVVVMSGPTLRQHPSDELEPLDINGSSVLVRASSEEEVRAHINEDIYAKMGVWDIERLTVTPIKCVVRKPL